MSFESWLNWYLSSLLKLRLIDANAFLSTYNYKFSPNRKAEVTLESSLSFRERAKYTPITDQHGGFEQQTFDTVRSAIEHGPDSDEFRALPDWIRANSSTRTG